MQGLWMLNAWWNAIIPKLSHIYVPSGMCSLNLALAIFAACGYLRSIYQCLLIQIESRSAQSALIESETIILEALFGCCWKPSGVNVFSFDRRDEALVTWDGCGLWLDWILNIEWCTLLWKWAYEVLYMKFLLQSWKASGSMVLLRVWLSFYPLKLWLALIWRNPSGC